MALKPARDIYFWPQLDFLLCSPNSDHFAYYCSFYFTPGPVILTLAILENVSPQQVTHLPLPYFFLCGIFGLPWHRHPGTRNLSFTSHSKDEAIEVKRLAQGHKWGILWQVLNPRCQTTYQNRNSITICKQRPQLWKATWESQLSKSPHQTHPNTHSGQL
jgi:hypothetical protein